MGVPDDIRIKNAFQADHVEQLRGAIVAVRDGALVVRVRHDAEVPDLPLEYLGRAVHAERAPAPEGEA